MEHEKQVETVKKALELEKQINVTKGKILKLKHQKFKAKPQPPEKKMVKREMPPIVPTTKFDWLLAVVLGIFTSGIGFIVYYFAVYRQKRKKEIEQIRNSAEYKQKCSQANAEFDRIQNGYDEQYEKAKENYYSVILPQYEKELEAWKKQRKNEIEQEENTLRCLQNKLAVHYQTTKIVPLQYRTIPALQYIYDMISTSDYSVREAIESYEKAQQRNLDIARLQEQRFANELADEQNDLLNLQNNISEKTRRDAKKASAVSAVQRHNTNKTLNEILRKKK